jgi:tetratricopeptide (TPR) repeat protein
MKSISKLKDRARSHEHKEDWRAAIEAYQQVLETQEADDAVELELGLYNRVGDLYLRLGQTDDAVKYYERAADRYADSGFFNNAIALCNKALRHRPDNVDVYLKLSRFCQEQGFLTDARRWIIDYAERKVKRGEVDDAVSGLEGFVDSSGAPDVRELIAKHLAGHTRQAEAVEQLKLAHAEWSRLGDEDAAARVAEKARALDPSVDLPTMAAGPPPAVHDELPGLDEPTVEDIGLETTAYGAREADEGDFTSAGGGLDGLETHRAEPADTGDLGIGGLETFQDAEESEDAEDDVEQEPLPFLDTGFEDEPEDEEEPEPLPLLDMGPELAPHDELETEPEAAPPWDEASVAPDAEAVDEAELEPQLEPQPEPGPVAESELEPVAEEEVEAEPEVEAEAEPEPMADDLEAEPATGAQARPPFEPMDLDFATLSFGGTTSEQGGAESGSGELDVDAVLDRAKQLVSRGLTGEAGRELRLLSGSDASPEVFRQALSVTNEILRHDPEDVTVLQRRVEFANRIGDRHLMVDTYIDLAAVLSRLGSETKARAMYLRVLDLDPDNSTALDALDAEPDPETGQVDLEAILREMSGEEAAAAAEGDESFAAMLAQVKGKVGDSAPREDAGDHYDLGLAFKEMGLIDEAISEFQTALTHGEERLKVYEELGQCFILKGQHNVALKILKRALKAPRQQEADLLGVYYHLGKCYEELGDRAEARAAYEKVLDINPHFGDVTSRVGRL